MIIAALLLALAAAPPASAPTAEAEALGLRLARTGTLGTLLPMLIAKDTDELVAEHKELGLRDAAKLRAVAAETGRSTTDRAMAVEGHAYAGLLSVAELRALVAFGESPVAARQRSVQPQVIAATVAGLAGFDFKKQALAAYCNNNANPCATPSAGAPAH